MAKYTPSLLTSSDPDRVEPINSRTLDESKYKIEHYQYPADLLGNKNQYGKNYAVFYINVAQDSKLQSDGTRLTKNDTVDINKSNAERSQLIAQAQTSGAKFADISNSLFEGSGDVAKEYGSNLINSTKRLKTAIALHMPNLGMQTRYGINYEEEGFLFQSAALEVASSGSSAIANAIAGKPSDDIDRAAGAAAGAGLFIAEKAGFGALQKLSGLAPNPKREQLFKSVDFRTFQMQYEFYPRDEKEAQNVQNIIKEFKFHMHPEYKTSAQFLYVYPSEFDIVYYHGTQENEKVNKHTSCVLTEVNVNYAPQGQFTTFPDGTPTQINLVLTFRELIPLTKETIAKGL